MEMANEVRNRLENENDKQLISNLVSDFEEYESVFGNFVKEEKMRDDELTQLKEESQNMLDGIASLENKHKEELERHINDESVVNNLNEFFIASELQTLINNLRENELNYDLTGKEEYVEKGLVKFVYKDFSVVGGREAAEAAHCAAEQDAFWQYHDKLFENL